MEVLFLAQGYITGIVPMHIEMINHLFFRALKKYYITECLINNYDWPLAIIVLYTYNRSANQNDIICKPWKKP